MKKFRKFKYMQIAPNNLQFPGGWDLRLNTFFCIKMKNVSEAILNICLWLRLIRNAIWKMHSFWKQSLGEMAPSSTLISSLPLFPEQFQRVAQCSWADLGELFQDREENGFHSINRIISKMQPCREVKQDMLWEFLFQSQNKPCSFVLTTEQSLVSFFLSSVSNVPIELVDFLQPNCLLLFCILVYFFTDQQV